MNKLIFTAAFTALCGAATVAVPALAQQAAASPQASTRTTPATRTSEVKRQHAVPPLDSRQCIRDTGSHIPPPKGQCLPVAGSSYSQQDLQRTGATNIGQALQMLDPSVTVHGH